MQWVCFVCPSCCQKRDNAAFELALQSALELLSPGRQFKLLEVVLHIRKGAKFGVQKVNGGQYICDKDTSVGKNCEKHVQSSKGYIQIHTHSKLIDLVAVVFSPNRRASMKANLCNMRVILVKWQ